jgi:hypothetical protein
LQRPRTHSTCGSNAQSSPYESYCVLVFVLSFCLTFEPQENADAPTVLGVGVEGGFSDGSGMVESSCVIACIFVC